MNLLRQKIFRRSRGFATLTAIFLIGLLGFAIAALAATFAFTAHRTSTEAADAQLRELIQAARIIAAQPNQSNLKDHPLFLPKELIDRGVKLTFHSTNNTTEITASFSPHEQQQVTIPDPSAHE